MRGVPNGARGAVLERNEQSRYAKDGQAEYRCHQDVTHHFSIADSARLLGFEYRQTHGFA